MDQMQVGAFIAALRKEKNMTQEQLAQKLGVTNRSVSRWENGHNTPDLSLFPILADELDVELWELLMGRHRTAEEMTELRDSLNTLLQISQKEKTMKTKKINRVLVGGALCLVLVLIQHQFSVFSMIFKEGMDEFVEGVLTGLATVFLLTGLYNNNRDTSLRKRKKELFSKMTS